MADTDQVEFPDHGQQIEGSDGIEVIVHDKDKDGNIIGWHKKPKGLK